MSASSATSSPWSYTQQLRYRFYSLFTASTRLYFMTTTSTRELFLRSMLIYVGLLGDCAQGNGPRPYIEIWPNRKTTPNLRRNTCPCTSPWSSPVPAPFNKKYCNIHFFTLPEHVVSPKASAWLRHFIQTIPQLYILDI